MVATYELDVELSRTFLGRNYGKMTPTQMDCLLNLISKYEPEELASQLEITTSKGISKTACKAFIKSEDLTNYGSRNTEFTQQQLEWLHTFHKYIINSIESIPLPTNNEFKMLSHLYGHKANIGEALVAKCQVEKQKDELIQETLDDYDKSMEFDGDLEYKLSHQARKTRTLCVYYQINGKRLEDLKQNTAKLANLVVYDFIQNPKSLFFILETLAKSTLEIAKAGEDEDFFEEAENYLKAALHIYDGTNARLGTLLAHYVFELNDKWSNLLETKHLAYGANNEKLILDKLKKAYEAGLNFMDAENLNHLPSISFVANLAKRIIQYDPENEIEWLKKSYEQEIIGADLTEKSNLEHSVISSANAGLTAARIYELTHEDEYKSAALQLLNKFVNHNKGHFNKKDKFAYRILRTKESLEASDYYVKFDSNGKKKTRTLKKKKKRSKSTRRIRNPEPQIDWEEVDDQFR